MISSASLETPGEYRTHGGLYWGRCWSRLQVGRMQVGSFHSAPRSTPMRPQKLMV